MEALYFSLSTMTTIGYGVSDYYFGGCWTPLLLVLWQVCSAITFDAVAVGLIFHRISRGTKRGRTILFSNKAVVQRVKGIPYLMFRIAELRSYHLIEATVRSYCVRHERLPIADEESSIGDSPQIETTHFICRQIKLLHPDENYGSHLWMGLPQVIVHRMDNMSPLVPKTPTWFDAQGIPHTTSPNEFDWKAMEDFLLDRDTEIVVLVQGVDEATGSTTQARHSYKACDLEWNHTFVNCSRPCSQGPAVEVDFSVFHDSLPVPQDTEACPYIPL
jgi:potassium inwardly-rectifying channel subfamily J